MKILVTGGYGFLGKALVQKLKEKQHDPIALSSSECDLSKPDALSFLLSIDADFVFHLAGKTKLSSPAEYYRANLDTTRSILEYCRLGNRPLHYVSTYVYGKQAPLPISEETPPFPLHPYAHSKWLAEELCLFYHRLYSFPLTISRPFNIYGPRQSVDFFIPRMIEQGKTSPIIRLQALHTKRDFIFIDDVVEALITLKTEGKAGQIYNIGTGICFSCNEVLQHLQQLMKIEKPVFLDKPLQEDLIPHAQADIRKICRETSWKPKHSLQEGLAKCL